MGDAPVDLMSCMLLSSFLDVIRKSMSAVSFLGQLRLWNVLPEECFPLTYDDANF